MPQHILTTLVENRPGVLARVSNLFRRRGFNIDSLTVGRTQREDLSRMTLVIDGSERDAILLEKNLYKLVNVIQVDHLTDVPSVCRELALIKVGANQEARREVTQLCDIFRARILDVSARSMVIEITGGERKIENFTELLRPFEIIEMVRTGAVALGRADHTLKDHGYRPHAAFAKTRKSVL